jgi:hypothetical protein
MIKRSLSYQIDIPRIHDSNLNASEGVVGKGKCAF